MEHAIFQCILIAVKRCLFVVAHIGYHFIQSLVLDPGDIRRVVSDLVANPLFRMEFLQSVRFHGSVSRYVKRVTSVKLEAVPS